MGDGKGVMSSAEALGGYSLLEVDEVLELEEVEDVRRPW